MGLFDKDKSQKSTKELKNYEIKQLGNSKLIFDFKKDCTFKHGDKLTNLIKARVLEEYEKHSIIAPDTAKYICFEIRENIKLQELAEKKVFDILNQMGKFKDLKNGQYNDIGIIDKIDEKYQLFKPTQEVSLYVEHVLNREISRSGELFSERVLHQNFLDKVATPVTEYIKENTEVREKRKQKPYFEEELRYKMGDKICTNYKGVDMIDGKRINIHRVNELEETPEQTLYSAYIQKLEEDDRIELKTLQAVPNGTPVLFTSEKKLEEIIENNNKEEIQQFLQLVSNLPKEKLNEMRFIGNLNKEGKIDRTQESCSEQIKEKIKEEKEKYKQEQQEELELV